MTETAATAALKRVDATANRAATTSAMSESSTNPVSARLGEGDSRSGEAVNGEDEGGKGGGASAHTRDPPEGSNTAAAVARAASDKPPAGNEKRQPSADSKVSPASEAVRLEVAATSAQREREFSSVPVPEVLQHLRDNFGPLATSMEPYIFRYGLVNQSVEEMYMAFKSHVGSMVMSLAGSDQFGTFRQQMKTMLTNILSDALGEQAETFAGYIATITTPEDLFLCLFDEDQLGAWVEYVWQGLYAQSQQQQQQQQQQRSYGGMGQRPGRGGGAAGGGAAGGGPSRNAEHMPPHQQSDQEYRQSHHGPSASAVSAGYRGGSAAAHADPVNDASTTKLDRTSPHHNSRTDSTAQPSENASAAFPSAPPTLQPYPPPADPTGMNGSRGQSAATASNAGALRTSSESSAARNVSPTGNPDNRTMSAAVVTPTSTPAEYTSNASSTNSSKNFINNSNSMSTGSIPRPLSQQSGHHPLAASAYPHQQHQSMYSHTQHQQQQQQSSMSGDPRPRTASQWSPPQQLNSFTMTPHHQHQQPTFPAQSLAVPNSVGVNSTVSVGHSSQNSTPAPVMMTQSPQQQQQQTSPPPRGAFTAPHQQHAAFASMPMGATGMNARPGMVAGKASMSPSSPGSGGSPLTPGNVGAGVGGVSVPLPASSGMQQQQQMNSMQGSPNTALASPPPRNVNIPVPLSVQQQQQQQQQSMQQSMQGHPSSQGRLPAGTGVLSQQQHQPAMMPQVGSPVPRTTFPPPPALQHQQQQPSFQTSPTMLPHHQHHHHHHPMPAHQQQQQSQRPSPHVQHHHQVPASVRPPSMQPSSNPVISPGCEGSQPQPDDGWASSSPPAISPAPSGDYQGRPSPFSPLSGSGVPEARLTPKPAGAAGGMAAGSAPRAFAAKIPVHHHHQQPFSPASSASPLVVSSSGVTSPLPPAPLPHVGNAPIVPVVSPQPHPHEHYAAATTKPVPGLAHQQLQQRPPANLDGETEEGNLTSFPGAIAPRPSSQVLPTHHHHHFHHHHHHQQQMQPTGMNAPVHPKQPFGMHAAGSPFPKPQQLPTPGGVGGGHMQQPSATALPPQQQYAQPQTMPSQPQSQQPHIASGAVPEGQAPQMERTTSDEELRAVLRQGSFREETVETVVAMGMSVQQLHAAGYQELDKVMRTALPTVMARQTLWKLLNERIRLKEQEEKMHQQQKQHLDLRNFMQKNSITAAGQEVSAESAAPTETAAAMLASLAQPPARPTVQVPQPRTKQQAQSPTQSTPTTAGAAAASSVASPTAASHASSDMDGSRRGGSSRSTPMGAHRSSRVEEVREDMRDEDRGARRGSHKRGSGVAMGAARGSGIGTFTGSRGGGGINGGGHSTRGGGGRGAGHHHYTGGASVEETQVCKFYMKPEGCQFGESCRYLHPSH